jgi:hypothetical protein
MELIEAKKIDHDKWKQWFEKLESTSKLLSNSLDELESLWPVGTVFGLDFSNPTKKGVDAFAVCENLFKEIVDIFEKDIPGSGPLSAKARLYSKKAIELKSGIYQSQENHLMQKRAYENSSFYVDFTKLSIQAEKMVQQSAFLLALEEIKKGLAYDPDNELLHYLEDICYNQLNKPRGIIEKIFGKH